MKYNVNFDSYDQNLVMKVCRAHLKMQWLICKGCYLRYSLFNTERSSLRRINERYKTDFNYVYKTLNTNFRNRHHMCVTWLMKKKILSFQSRSIVNLCVFSISSMLFITLLLASGTRHDKRYKPKHMHQLMRNRCSSNVEIYTLHFVSWYRATV